MLGSVDLLFHYGYPLGIRIQAERARDPLPCVALLAVETLA
jgi:hypothetical protein